MSRRILTNAFALLACSALLVASFGCNPGNVTAPSSTPDVVTSPDFVRILSTSKGMPDLAQSPDASRMVSAEFGGTVRAGRYSLEFPPGALNEDTEITIQPDSDGTLGVELLPHGIQFNEPVILRMDLNGTSAEGMADRCSTLWLNDNAGWWERMTTEPVGSNETAAELWHFSGYKTDING